MDKFILSAKLFYFVSKTEFTATSNDRLLQRKLFVLVSNIQRSSSKYV